MPRDRTTLRVVPGGAGGPVARNDDEARAGALPRRSDAANGPPPPPTRRAGPHRGPAPGVPHGRADPDFMVVFGESGRSAPALWLRCAWGLHLAELNAALVVPVGER